MEKQISQGLTKQLNLELFSAYLYLDFSNFYAQADLTGFAHWYRVQTQEERDHALMFLAYLQDSGEAAALSAVAAPPGVYKSFEQPLALALEHEQAVTASIHRLYGMAMDAKDYRTTQFLDWFVAEQREEEKTARELQSKFRLFGGEQKSLYLLNSELQSRVYTPANPQP